MKETKRPRAAVVGQSGGPTAAINATLSGVIRGALASEEISTLYGMRNGIAGLMEERLVDLSARFEGEGELSHLESTPAAALGSCRVKLPKADDARASETYDRIFRVLEKYDIGYFFYIGGNDSMDTVAKMTAEAKRRGYDLCVMGVPKTIDNDLAETDHTPGFGSAAKYIATTMQEILADCAVYTVKAVTIVEIMGRDAGWLTVASALPRVTSGVAPDLVYLPERAFSLDAFLRDVRASLDRHPNVVIAVSEGLRFGDGRYVGEGTQSGALDVFGHRYLAGTAKALEAIVKQEIGCKVRSIELNLPQRCAAHMASGTDIRESVAVGRAAVRRATKGKSGCMMSIQRKKGERYGVYFKEKPISEIANAVRDVPAQFINAEGNNVTDECLAYLLPLIQGERKLRYENGLPVHCVI